MTKIYTVTDFFLCVFCRFAAILKPSTQKKCNCCCTGGGIVVQFFLFFFSRVKSISFPFLPRFISAASFRCRCGVGFFCRLFPPPSLGLLACLLARFVASLLACLFYFFVLLNGRKGGGGGSILPHLCSWRRVFVYGNALIFILQSRVGKIHYSTLLAVYRLR